MGNTLIPRSRRRSYLPRDPLPLFTRFTPWTCPRVLSQFLLLRPKVYGRNKTSVPLTLDLSTSLNSLSSFRIQIRTLPLRLDGNEEVSNDVWTRWPREFHTLRTLPRVLPLFCWTWLIKLYKSVWFWRLGVRSTFQSKIFTKCFSWLGSCSSARKIIWLRKFWQ